MSEFYTTHNVSCTSRKKLRQESNSIKHNSSSVFEIGSISPKAGSLDNIVLESHSRKQPGSNAGQGPRAVQKIQREEPNGTVKIREPRQSSPNIIVQRCF
jgi:hypothetical protein